MTVGEKVRHLRLIESRLRGLDALLQNAGTLARETFAPIERLEFEVHQDPEIEDEWIVLRVVVRQESVDVPAARKKYAAAWVATAPSSHRSLIRLSPDIL